MGGAARVLVVDPARERRGSREERLAAAGFATDGVDDVAAAVEAVEAEPVDCVVTAHSLLDGDGLELTRRLAAAHPSVPVVLLADEGSERLASDAVAAGVAGYVPADDPEVDLVERVRTVVDDGVTQVDEGEPDDVVPLEDGDEGGADGVDGCDSEESELAVDRLEALRQASHELRTVDDIATLAERVIELAEEMLDQPLASVRLYDPERDALVPVAATDSVTERFDDVEGGVPSLGDPGNPFWEAYESGQQQVREITEAPFVESSDPGGSVSLLLQPLGDHGLLAFGSPAADPFGPRVAHLASILGASAETALDRLDTERALADYGRKVARLHGVGSDLQDVDDVDAVYDVAVTAAQEVLEFDASVVSAARDDGTRFETVAVGGDLAGEEYYEETDDEGLVGRTFHEGETFIVDPVEDDVEAAGPYRTVLSAPVGDHAVFQAASTDAEAFDERDVELAEVLLAHVREALSRAKTQDALRSERDRLSTLRDSVPDPIMRVELRPGGEAAIRDVNAAFAATFGVDEAAVAGRDPRAVIAPPEEGEFVRRIHRRVRAGETIETELRRETVDGVREFAVSVVPVENDEDRTVAYALYRDVTERKRRRRRLAVLNRILRHDVRNAMNVVDGYANSIRQSADDEQVVEWAEVVGDRADRLLSLAEHARSAEEVLDPGAGDVETCDVAAAVRSAVDDVRAEYPEASIDLGGARSAVVEADPHVELAVTQLLENAVVAGDDAEAAVDVSVEAGPDAVTIAVTGDGPGIPAAEREVLTGERSVDQLHHGSGLGLWLVKWVVTQSGGDLEFTEAPDGTTVLVRFPRSANGSPSPAQGTTD